MRPLHIVAMLTLSRRRLIGGTLLTAEPDPAHTWLGDCVVVDSTIPLPWTHHGQARGSFGYPTGIDTRRVATVQCHPPGLLDLSPSLLRNYINVEDMTYGHIHLTFDSPSLLTPCFRRSGRWSRRGI